MTPSEEIETKLGLDELEILYRAWELTMQLRDKVKTDLSHDKKNSLLQYKLNKYNREMEYLHKRIVEIESEQEDVR